MRILAIFCVVTLSCGGDDACDDYCEVAVSRLVECGIFVDSARGKAISECERELDGTSESQCAQAIDLFRGTSCGKLEQNITCSIENEHRSGASASSDTNCAASIEGSCGDTDECREDTDCGGGHCAWYCECVECTDKTADDDCASGHCDYIGQCIDCTDETEAEDCAKNEGCDSGYCHQRCIDDEDCGPFRGCSLNFCSEPVGTSCEGENGYATCGISGSCETLDVNANPVTPYCSIFCSPVDNPSCPSGYTCANDYMCRPPG